MCDLDTCGSVAVEGGTGSVCGGGNRCVFGIKLLSTVTLCFVKGKNHVDPVTYHDNVTSNTSDESNSFHVSRSNVSVERPAIEDVKDARAQSVQT